MVDDKNKKVKPSEPGKKTEKMTPVLAKPEVSDLIGQRLRKFYDEVADQPVPDRFLDLLSQLEAASAQKKPN